MAHMRILLTNDDGIDAPGLQCMLAALASKHEVWVSAPSLERSGASHSLTMHDPIRVVERGQRQWAVSGTPVDCVYLALHRFTSTVPDLVISGINKGANLGDDVFYSGTVGAAREAALNQIPAIAVSLDNQNWPGETHHFDSAAELTLRLIEQMEHQPLPSGLLVNLNVPNRRIEDIASVEVCRLGRRHYEPVVEERVDPRGKPYYWIGGEPVSGNMDEHTDGWWLHHGHAAMTVLGLDNTAHAHLSHLTQWNLSHSNGT